MEQNGKRNLPPPLPSQPIKNFTLEISPPLLTAGFWISWERRRRRRRRRKKKKKWREKMANDDFAQKREFLLGAFFIGAPAHPDIGNRVLLFS